MPTTYADLLRRARAEIPEVSAAEVLRLRDDPRAVIVDVREDVEWAAGHVPGARHVARSHLERDVEAAVLDRSLTVVLYCAAGIRSLLAGSALRAMGFEDVRSMAGGFAAWRAAGLPSTRPAGLSEEQQRRYSRHLLMPEIGPEGQARLLGSRVLVVGAGGLGSPAVLYLAAAGVGTVEVVDFDVVDVSNLQRQVLHSTDRVGQQKVVSAATAVHALNPDVKVVGHAEALGPANAAGLIDGCDLVIDGTDSFETRYALNDAAVAAGIPVVHASVFRFEGQLTTFVPHAGPCYRCLHPAPPPPELAPACSIAGVLGVVPGIMGLLQANEALKLLLGIGDTLVGRLLLFDALDTSFSELRLERDPACPACGDGAT